MIYYILSGLVILALIGYVLYLRNNRLQVVLINKERQEENKRIEQDIALKQRELAKVKEDIVSHNEIVNSLNDTANKLRESAEQRAEESARAQFEKKSKELDETYQAKELSYIQAQQRQEAIAADQDYYRLTIDEIDISDIELLRELQKRFFKKEAIDKLIWETYYKPSYDTLMARLFPKATKVCGIYKITDLTTGQAYIGQSVDIKERFRQHIKSSLAYGPATNKLYQTMQKSGQHNFIFEILEEVPRASLNERETYWIDFYKTKDYGLNSTRGGS